MARVLVVSRNPAMAMGLSGADHEVVDLRPPAFADWIDSDARVDALVLDLENPRLAAAAVGNLRAHAKPAPVLLVASDRPGWDDPSLRDLPGTQVLPLPVSRPALLAALDRLLAPVAAPVGEVPRHTDVVQALEELVLDAADLLPDSEDDVPVPTARAAAAPRQPEPDAGPAEPTLSSVPRTQRRSAVPAVDMTASLRELQALRPPAVPPAPARPAEPTTAPAPAAPPAESPIGLVRRLLAEVGGLFGVPETAEVVISDAVERTRADAGALLVPDGGSWRVAAGVRLRPLEHRYQLAEDSWLVEKVARAHQGVIIEESDVAREQIHGAPLASWRHLLAAPVPQVHAVLLLARREDPPFDESALATLAALGVEAQPLLSAAVDTRALSRALREFRDEADPPR